MIQGADFSHYTSHVDFVAYKKGGWTYCFLKATEGNSNKDAKFPQFWAAARAAGVKRGAYHFFHPDIDANVQAKFFLDYMGPLEAGDLAPVLDLEIDGGCDAADVVKGAITFLQAVEAGCGKKPYIYASPGFLQSIGNPSAFAAYPLWLARYTNVQPIAPKPWAKWVFWQNSESGVAPGVLGHCDTNFFDGTQDELSAL